MPLQIVMGQISKLTFQSLDGKKIYAYSWNVTEGQKVVNWEQYTKNKVIE